MKQTTRSDIKVLAQQIENLAKEVQSSIDNNGDVIGTANELVRNSTTFVFALGEVYALEQAGITALKRRVGNPNYHNIRNARGQFARKV